MQQEEFEKRIKEQLDETFMNPSSGSWEKLERLLPPEKKNRKGVFMFWSILLAGCIAAYFIFKPVIMEDPAIALKSPASKHQPVKHSDVSAQQPNTHDWSVKKDFKNPNDRVSSGHVAYRANKKYRYRGGSVADIYQKYLEPELYITAKKLTLNKNSFHSFNPPRYQGEWFAGLPIPDDDTPESVFNPNDSMTRFMVGASAYITGTYRHLRTMRQASEQQQSQVALRNQIERVNVDFNGGLFFKMKVYKNWYAGTGVYIYNCSERINFAFKQNVPDRPIPAIAMNDLYLKKNLNNPDVFRLQGDSIYAGNPSTDKMNTLINQYYYNEIPLSFTWFKSGKTYNWFAEGGLSLARLTVINTSLLELDQIGFTGVTDRVNYSGISSWIVNAGTSAGIGINLNRNFHMDLSAEFKYALTPLINFGYARQYPYAFGGGIVFARRF